MKKLVTPSGRAIDLDELVAEFSPAAICLQGLIDEISLGLANTLRFGGNVRGYSVAQHSCLVQSLVSCGIGRASVTRQRLALFHDASEAYLGDVPTPIKDRLPDYRRLERRMTKAIFNRLGLVEIRRVDHDAVKKADQSAFVQEVFCFLPQQLTQYGVCDPTPTLCPRELPFKWALDMARLRFRSRALNLGLA